MTNHTSCAAGAASFEVKWVGAQKHVLGGDLSAAISLSSLERLENLYALGPLEGVKGEITIIESIPSVARVTDDGVTIDTSFCHGACFLAYTQVERWQKVVLPYDVLTEADPEQFLSEAAGIAGIDPGIPFPFLLKGLLRSVDFHILNKTDGLPHNPQRHDQAKVHYRLENAAITIIGFYSDHHRGIFTPRDHAIHQHVVSADGRVSGHVEKIVISADAQLFLPVP